MSIWHRLTSSGQRIARAENWGSSLENADLENADLRPQTSDLENADLENTDLENTDLENTDLENTDLENADLAEQRPTIENTDVSQTLFKKITAFARERIMAAMNLNPLVRLFFFFCYLLLSFQFFSH